MRKDMKKCPKPLGYGIRRTHVVLGLSAALCMPAAFSYANVCLLYTSCLNHVKSRVLWYEVIEKIII